MRQTRGFAAGAHKPLSPASRPPWSRPPPVRQKRCPQKAMPTHVPKHYFGRRYPPTQSRPCFPTTPPGNRFTKQNPFAPLRPKTRPNTRTRCTKTRDNAAAGVAEGLPGDAVTCVKHILQYCVSGRASWVATRDAYDVHRAAQWTASSCQASTLALGV